MAAIIDFKEYRSKAKQKSDTSVFYSQQDFFWRMMENRKILLPVFMEISEEAIRNCQFDPDDFVIDPISMRDYMGALFDAEKPGDEIEGPAFNFITDNQIVRITTYAVVDEKAMIEFTADIYRIENYNKGNREWLFFNGQVWDKGPTEDFFDLEQILNPETSDY